MKSKKSKEMLISALICMLPILLALTVYDRLPAQIAVHFNSSGEPDNYFPKALAAFGLPIFLTVINLYTHFRINNDPKADNASFVLRQAGKWLIPIISVIIMPITLFMAMGVNIPILILVQALVGAVIVVSGNYLPKCRRNYTIGIKLPWTLDSDDNWNKTHRFAGFVWVTGGLIFIANAFISANLVTLVIIILLIVLPPVYSYLIYRRQNRIQE